ncbi:eukaryotic translation elongation factor 1 delta b (guanine nucleotide exchange protein) isoform X2 [Scyliorhinus canicula]|uniref:eukaryotic translation elongation factor 1 delta b (guanine nucleotide exchange protein) isoform X2 n=1 Tax=Scyliorhinus canicula TaxID=7830 RepID=UPI0018F6D923|nr:eukaryotic translation elongation factor 1 delta b (guanine nucleotide exchange protein) isoform X2 [Scyliorhinus canicula]
MRIRKHPYLLETIWMDKYKFDEAERLFHEGQQASAASAMAQAAQETDLAQRIWPLAGEEVRQEREVGKKRRRKRSPRAPPEEVVRAHRLEMAGPPVAPGTVLVKGAARPAAGTRPPSRGATPGCVTRPLVACCQLVHGVWLNKSTFDEAESLFIVRSQARCVPHSLPIPTSAGTAIPKLWTTPDEGYISATPVTPITPGFPIGGDTGLPVNGMFPSASQRPLALKVWLEKPLYDDAERLYHEILYGGSATDTQHTGPPQIKQQRTPAASLPPAHQSAKPRLSLAVGEDPAAAAAHLVDEGSEPVWFSKPKYDAAELRYHLARTQRAANETREPMVDSTRAPPLKRPASHCPRLQDKTMAVNVLTEEKIWFDKCKYDDAETQYYIHLNNPVTAKEQNPPAMQENGASNILRDIARARENIQKSLAGIQSVWEANSNPKETVQDNVDPVSSHSAVQGSDVELCTRVTSLEKENQSLHQVVEDLRLALSKLETRLSTLEKSSTSPKPVVCPPAPDNKPSTKQPEAAEDEDDDIDLFGSSDEEESAEKERIREERLREYAAKKSKKPALIAKSSILLDVKPWDDETDMVELEESVRTVQLDGLVWGGSKLVPVGYGIRKLQIQCVVEDDKVGTDLLEEEITKFEDYVQSVDVAAFNKI